MNTEISFSINANTYTLKYNTQENGGDIFKLRMYEYLCEQNKLATEEQKASLFEQISQLYANIDSKNQAHGWVTDILGVLDVYKYIVVAKYDLPKNLYFYETNRFFEELFDTLLNTHRSDNFKNIKEKGLTLSLHELEQIINARFHWHVTYNNAPTAEDACSWHFIWQSRYSRYHIVAYLFTYRFMLDHDFVSKLFQFKKQLSKLFIIYSIRYQKIKREIYYTFMNAVLDALINKSYSELMALIKAQIGTVNDHKGAYDIEHILNGDITYNAKLKNIICRLSAMLEEDYTSSNTNIPTQLFNAPINIEHIQSFHDYHGERRDDVWEAWGDDLNAIGNLMILEQDKNRTNSSKPFVLKVSVYHTSMYAIVKNQATTYSSWSLVKCQERKEREIKKILDYLFS